MVTRRFSALQTALQTVRVPKFLVPDPLARLIVIYAFLCCKDCTQPADDEILDVSDFEKFLLQRVKVDGKTGNLGEKGMQRFLRTHQHTLLCEQLGLPNPNAELSDAELAAKMQADEEQSAAEDAEERRAAAQADDDDLEEVMRLIEREKAIRKSRLEAFRLREDKSLRVR